MLKEKELFYGEHLNVCVYRDGVKEMLNKEGRATEQAVTSLYKKEGATIQFFQPQQYSEELHVLCHALEQVFGCLVGANVYLTPPKAQGLAPHYDDVDVFILQVEGSKRWKLYSPPPEDELPMEYSRDLTQEEAGKPLMEVVLNRGDMMYFPRGVIHQAATSLDAPSTHITISTYQRNCWADFLKTALPLALTHAAEEDVEFRRGLPINYFSYMGIAHDAANLPPSSSPSSSSSSSTSSSTSASNQWATTAQQQQKQEKQQQFHQQVKTLLQRLERHLLLHHAADQASLDFTLNRLPPLLPSAEQRVIQRLMNSSSREEAAKDKKGKGKENKKQRTEETDEEAELERERGAEPTLDGCWIRLRNPDWLRVVTQKSEEEEDGEGENDEEEEEDHDGEEEEEDEEEAKSSNPKKNLKEEDEEEEDESDEEAQLHTELARYQMEQEGEDDDEEKPEEDMLIFHCLQNSREHHMNSRYRPEPRCLQYPGAYKHAMAVLFSAWPEFVPVRSLPLDDEEQLQALVVSLWVEGLLQTRSHE
ncbi:Bifunctional lysine-specific demethylase and histidyl-hydroxylase [Balamuthia mandrillaris]